MEKILVGIDDSPNARVALRWALEHSAPDDEVVAVHVWHMPATGGFETTYLDPAPFEQGAQAAAVAVVAEVVGDLGIDEDRVRIRIIGGHPSAVMIEEGRSADHIVLGARGHGGFAGLVLGSVTTSVVNHAPCPVTVVPSD